MYGIIEKIIKQIKEEAKRKITVYNTLTKDKDLLVPHNNRIDMFVCGPTVYDYAHLGHARSYVIYDSFVKFLRLLDISVFYVQNITDIDDKIIKRANEKHLNWSEISRFFEEKYFEDMNSLNVNAVNIYARATEHIPEIIQQVEILLKKGFAYITEDGVYFDVTKFPEYGKLSGQKLDDLKAGARIEINENKKHPWDFALWKFKKPSEPFWEAPFGSGRPGWHIEDTAIAMRYHGFQYDLHGGGLDLIFPHHESEIAQMEAISGKKPFVKIWMHHGFLEINHEKMSKSLGNFFTIREFLKKHSPESLRYFILLTHYRGPIDFTEESFNAAEKRLQDLNRAYKQVMIISENKENTTIRDLLLDYYKEFINALADDFNTPKANEVINRLFSLINARILKNQEEVLLTKKILKEINSVFEIFKEESNTIHLVSIIESILHVRQKLRDNKLYEYSDMIRDVLQKNGIRLFDEKNKTRWIIE